MNSLFRTLTEIGRAIRFELLSTLGTLLTVFLAITLPGAFWVTSKNLVRVESGLKNALTMDVFLKNELPPSDVDSLRLVFLSLEGVAGARYVSKEEALFKMRETFGLEMIRGLDENPLPASFVLSVSNDVFNPGSAESLISKISGFPEVDDVVFAGEMITRLGKIMRSVEILGLALSMLIAISAIFIVANTVRVAISDRKKTVEIMQLVGATRGYILTPFVSLGGILGLLGASLAVLALAWLSDYVTHHLVAVIFLETHEVIAFLLSGLLLGMIGALIATKRYLKI
jgi:cell division transport system permease protein